MAAAIEMHDFSWV